MTISERAHRRHRRRLLVAAALVTTASCATASPPADPPSDLLSAKRLPHVDKRAVKKKPSHKPKPSPSPSPRPHVAALPHTGDPSGIPAVWRRLAACESSGRWGISNYPYEGGLQHHWRTWAEYRPRNFPQHGYDATPAQQVFVAKRVLRAQGPGAWPRCSIVAGLTMKDAA